MRLPVIQARFRYFQSYFNNPNQRYRGKIEHLCEVNEELFYRFFSSRDCANYIYYTQPNLAILPNDDMLSIFGVIE